MTIAHTAEINNKKGHCVTGILQDVAVTGLAMKRRQRLLCGPKGRSGSQGPCPQRARRGEAGPNRQCLPYVERIGADTESGANISAGELCL